MDLLFMVLTGDNITLGYIYISCCSTTRNCFLNQEADRAARIFWAYVLAPETKLITMCLQGRLTKQLSYFSKPYYNYFPCTS